MKNKKYRIQKDLAYLSISLCLIVFLWIGSNIYNAYVTSTIDDTLQLQIIPIKGKFDVDTIEDLKNRRTILPDYKESFASLEAEIINTSPTPETSKPKIDTSVTISPLNSPIPSNFPLDSE